MARLVLVGPDERNMPPDLLERLGGLAEYRYVGRPLGEELAEAEVLVAGSQRVDGAFLERAPALRLVARFGVGYDSVDVDECTRRGVYVTHTPGVLSGGVADHTWALILGFNRRLVEADAYARGGWGRGEPYIGFGWDLEGKTLGILGLGRIGLEVLKRSVGFGVRTIYHDLVRRPEAEEEYGARYVSFEELLRQSDILTIHVALTESTRGLLDGEALSKMKPTALLVNTSRGGVVDEDALVEALREGWIRGAALDVFREEPLPPGSPLTSMGNVLLTPHCASATWETRRKMAECVLENVEAYLKGETPPNLVPEQKGLVF